MIPQGYENWLSTKRRLRNFESIYEHFVQKDISIQENSSDWEVEKMYQKEVPSVQVSSNNIVLTKWRKIW